MLVAFAIVGGVASAEPAVVALERDGVLACSGSVIAPHAVLTAAHCLADTRPFTVDGHTVIASLLAPDYDRPTLAHDLAIVIVDPPFVIAPLPYAFDVAAGDSVLLVGFGRTMPADTAAFARRAGTATLDGVDAGSLRSRGPALTCEGDSGGPAIAGGVIVGVTSSGDCATFSRHVRVDVAFVTNAVAATAAGAAAAGDRCYHDANCADGVACVPAADEPRRSFCAPACTTSCPGDLACIDGLCRHPLPSPGAEGATCAMASDCAGELCVAERGGEDRYCARRCFSELPGFDCPSGTRCVAASDGGEACLAIPDADGGCRVAPDPALLLGLLGLAQLLRGRGCP